LLFDQRQHGYDAAAMQQQGRSYDPTYGRGTTLSEPITAIYQCGHCGDQILETYTSLEYPNDLFDDAAFAGQESDFFSWFTVISACSMCASRNIVADFECA